MSERQPFDYRVTSSSASPTRSAGTYTFTFTALCPDLLRYEQIGAAAGMRGRVVRAFFFLMRAWPPR